MFPSSCFYINKKPHWKQSWKLPHRSKAPLKMAGGKLAEFPPASLCKGPKRNLGAPFQWLYTKNSLGTKPILGAQTRTQGYWFFKSLTSYVNTSLTGSSWRLLSQGQLLEGLGVKAPSLVCSHHMIKLEGHCS